MSGVSLPLHTHTHTHTQAAGCIQTHPHTCKAQQAVSLKLSADDMISDKNYEEQRRGRADRSDSIFHWAEQSIAGVGGGRQRQRTGRKGEADVLQIRKSPYYHGNRYAEIGLTEHLDNNKTKRKVRKSQKKERREIMCVVFDWSVWEGAQQRETERVKKAPTNEERQKDRVWPRRG